MVLSRTGGGTLSDSFDMEVGSSAHPRVGEARMVVSLSVRWGGAKADIWGTGKVLVFRLDAGYLGVCTW